MFRDNNTAAADGLKDSQGNERDRRRECAIGLAELVIRWKMPLQVHRVVQQAQHFDHFAPGLASYAEHHEMASLALGRAT